MLVKCSQPYVLKCDDVVWSPISQRDGDDVYLLNTSGFITIYVDNERIFHFWNNIVPNFHHTTNILRFLNGTEVVKLVQGQTSYIQTTPPNEEVTSITLSVVTVESVEDVRLLELVVNNGNGSITQYSGETNTMRITITDYDKSNYLYVKLGNVLLTFVTAEE